jgi:ABC-type nickel/cobalt efflux system permease component RcnA
MSVVCGLALDGLYLWLGLSAQATLGTASELVPHWLQVVGAFVLLGLSIKPIARTIRAKLARRGHSKGDHAHDHHDHGHDDVSNLGEGEEEVEACSGST